MDKKQNKSLKDNSLSEISNECTVHETVYFDADTIPQDLKLYPQWVLWKIELRDGRSIKVPYTVQGYETSIKDPGTWTDFETAYAVLNENSGTYRGLGFVLKENDPFIFFDKEEFTNLNSYFENSKIDMVAYFILIRAIEKLRLRNGCIGIYSSGRYFAITDCTTGTSFTVDEVSEPTVKVIYKKNDHLVFFGHFVYRGLNAGL